MVAYAKLKELCEHTVRIGPSLYRIQQLHTRDIINVYLGLQYHNQPFPIHLDTQHRSREYQFTYRRLPLSVSSPVHL